MNEPVLIAGEGFQEIWMKAVKQLRANGWDLWDLVVRISDPNRFDSEINEKIVSFAKENSILLPRQVSYTIFPENLAKNYPDYDQLRHMYLHRLFPKLMKMEKAGWGTYFQRMICSGPKPKALIDEGIDQLGSILNAIKNDQKLYKTAFTMTLSIPGSDNTRRRGGPCLNTIAIRQEKYADSERVINLLAVYRNHDFLERAYGNYLGLCNLLKYIAKETGSRVGTLTCISSRAYADHNHIALADLVDKL